MSDVKINCPECGAEFPLSENLAGPLLQKERQKFKERLADERAKLTQSAKDEARKLAQAEIAKQAQDAENMRTRLKDMESKLSTAQKEQAEMLRMKRALEDEKREMDLTLEKRLQEEADAIRQKTRAEIEQSAKDEARKLAQAEIAKQAQDAENMRTRLKDMESKLSTAQKEQAEMLRMKRALEDEKREMDLNLEKRLQEEADAIRQKTRAEIETQHALKVREKEQQIFAMSKQIDDLKRRAEQGSQQHQGEVLETAVEDMLRRHFPFDDIVEIKKGESGADILQKVMSPNGRICGSILWETKRTKAWSGSWIPKLKTDQRAKGAQLAVLLSMTLPKELDGDKFCEIDGVWVTGFSTAMSLAAALRMNLIEVNNVLATRDGQATKAEAVYEYLTGTRFRHRVEAIVEKFSLMRDDLEREKKVMMKNWAKREGQIEAVIGATMGMYGDLEAIAGQAMPDIEGLEDDTPLIEF